MIKIKLENAASFQCNFCGVLVRNRKLARHISVDQPYVKKIVCHCGQTCATKYNFQVHCNRFHNGNQCFFLQIALLVREQFVICILALIRKCQYRVYFPCYHFIEFPRFFRILIQMHCIRCLVKNV